MKRVAVITDAVSPEFFFPVWRRYYGGLFGAENLHVVTYKDLGGKFAGIPLGNLWAVNAAYDDTLRIGVIADLISALLRSHDVVLRCDVDEFLIPDPARFTDLADFIERNTLPYVTAQGIDVVELAEDAPLDLDKPIFGVQRHYGMRAAALNKTCVTTIPLRWAEGFHGANVPPRFAGLYNLHLKFADLKRRIAWDQTILQGLTPGSQAHDYFSLGIEHLTGVQNHMANLQRGGVETQAEFDARFLATVGHNQLHDIHQGDFITQNFLVPLSDIGIATPAPAGLLRAYDGLLLTRAPAAAGALKQLEAPQTAARLAPALVADLSGRGLGLGTPAQQTIHGSYLVQRRDALLFGSGNLVTPDGHWTQPGGGTPEGAWVGLPPLGAADVQLITTPVFLATPPEPEDWGSWIATVAARAAQYRQHGGGRKFFCPARHDWQRDFLQLLGIAEQELLPHDPGRVYICRDVMIVAHSAADSSISAAERMNFFELAIRCRVAGKLPRRLFVSGGALGNQAALAAALQGLGFIPVVPEQLPAAARVALFAAAEQVVFTGGPDIFNAAFCAPGSSVITIEATAEEAERHSAVFASLDMRHGVIFCESDENRRWMLDIPRALPVIEGFFGNS